MNLPSLNRRFAVIGSVLILAACADSTPMLPVDPELSVLDCDHCPALVRIPAGSYLLGSPASEAGRVDDEGPQQAITLGAFAVSRYEVTVAEYAAFVAATDYNDQSGCFVMWNQGEYQGTWGFDPEASWRNPGFAQTDFHPVTCISAAAADAYVTWLNDHVGVRAYRLLSESEWEYVARAGSTTSYWWGEQEADFCRYANGVDQTARAAYPGWQRSGPCDDGYLFTAPVGSYGQANSFGLYDTAGNVWEWVADCYVDHYGSHPADGTPVETDTCERRVMRGGAWGDYGAFYLRTAYRGAWDGAGAFANIGLRVAATLRSDP
ncbi:MAG: formylglycine-generating enzyme family protein [Pseudomonadota bacterium]